MPHCRYQSVSERNSIAEPCLSLPTSFPFCSAQVRLEQAENRMDLAMVADIKYGALADVEEAIKKKEAERPENPMLAEVVGPDAIAKV